MQPPRPPAPPMMPGGCGMKGAQGKMGPGQMPGMQFMGRPPLGMPMGKGGLGMLNGMGMMPGMQGMMQGMPGMQGQMVMPPLGAPGNPGFQLNGCKGGGKDGGKFGGKDFGGKDGGKFGCGKDGGKFGGKDGGKGMMGNDNGEQSVADALVSALNALGPPPSGPCGCGPPPGMPGMTGPRPNGMGSMPGMMMQLPPGMLPPPPGILPPGMMPGMMPPPPGMMPPGFMNMPMPPGFDGQLTVPILPPGGQEGGAVGGKQFPWEGTSGVQCKYARACKNSQCTDEHLDGRDIDKDPNSTICRFGRKCKRQGCFFVHPQGRDIDDDPSKGMCRQGIGCKRADCLYAHPEERKVEGAESRACHICGLSGHIMKDCTKARRGGIASLPIVKGQYVEMTKFPDDWQEMGTEKLTSQIAAELEVFGTLSLLPTLVDGHNKAIAAFEEDDAAQAAVDALASVFSIALCEPPKPADLGDSKAGSLLITDFPARWQAADIGALLHGSVKPSMLIGIDMIPEEEGKGPAGRVRFRDFGSAREAAKELQGQKVAGKPLSITLEDEDGSPQDINAAIEDSRNDRTWGRDRERGSGGMELCQDYRMDRCTRGDRCKFSHGEEDSERKREMLERERKRKERGDEDRDRDRDRRDSWKDRDRGRDRSRSRDRDRSRGRGDDRRGGGREKAKIAVLHIDELAMPRRPDVPPAPSDREVYVDPLPDEDLLDTCVNAFGTAEEIYQLPGSGDRRGYVKFRDHAAAARAVEAGFGAWSESERVLSSQRSKKQDGTVSTYPDSIIARLVGSRGDSIRKLQEECGAQWLHLRGEDLGHSDHKFSSSQRVHFIAEGDDKAHAKMKEVLERRMVEIHENIREALKERDGRRGDDHDTDGWRPPGGEDFSDPWMHHPGPGGPPPPPWGHPGMPPPDWGPGPDGRGPPPPGWGPPPPHWGPPPGPDAWGHMPPPGGPPPPGWGGPGGPPPPGWGPPPPGWGPPPPGHPGGPPPGMPPPGPPPGEEQPPQDGGHREGREKRHRHRRGGSASDSPGRSRRRRREE